MDKPEGTTSDGDDPETPTAKPEPDRLSALRRAAVALEAALREAARLAGRGGSSNRFAT
jgi:hypothetical protein